MKNPEQELEIPWKGFNGSKQEWAIWYLKEMLLPLAKEHDLITNEVCYTLVLQAIQAERDAGQKLVDALNAARDSICEQATDTMWVDKKYSFNCTTVDYIDSALAAYNSATEGK